MNRDHQPRFRVETWKHQRINGFEEGIRGRLDGPWRWSCRFISSHWRCSVVKYAAPEYRWKFSIITETKSVNTLTAPIKLYTRKKMALCCAASARGCMSRPLMLMALCITSIQPSSDTISKRISKALLKSSNEYMLPSVGFVHARGAR